MPRLPLAALILLGTLLLACSDDDTDPTATPVSPGATQTSDSNPTPTQPGPLDTPAPGSGPLIGSWTQLAPLPTPRSEVAVAAVNGLIYVVGGFEASGAPSTKVEVYDPETNTWSAAPDLPRPRHHTAAAGWDSDLLVIGGFEQGFDDPVATVFRLDTETATWSENPSLLDARGAHASTNMDGNPVVFGGVDTEGRGLVSAEWLDAESEQWHFFDSEMTVARDHLAAATRTCPTGGDALQDCAYVIGGRADLDYARNLDANESNSGFFYWNTLAPLPTARSGIAAAAENQFGRIYVFGGEAPSGTFDTVEVYDPETNTWDTAEPLPTARHGMGAAVVDGVIYVIGGGPTPGLSVSGANEAYKP